MSKNIILCADGTGNRGGETPDTNVYRMYHVVDLHDPKRKREQITFYDNGIGTSTNKYIRSLTGALGCGFGRNVRDLYEFLAKNYDEGDIVYLFGFSRGAATVRAFGGMLQECGLVDRNHTDCKTGGEFDYDKFVDLIGEAFKHYRDKKGNDFKSKGYAIKEVRIKFMGIWDTVSALGFPYQRTGDSLFEDLLERPLPVWMALACDKIFNFGPLAHTFYNYTPNKIVDHVYHAIAIDDERKSFLPRVWNETEAGLKGNITQVWFAGMHSDVGGSYNQTGLAYETMVWMMERGEHHGLDFVEGALQEAKDKANVHGRLHNSRDGLAIYYRYAPRNIMELCTKNQTGRPSKLNGPIKIHQSVIDRMDRPTDRYAPGLLPAEFEIVDTPIPKKNNMLVDYGIASKTPVDPHVINDSPATVKSEGTGSNWKEDRTKVEAVVRYRRRLYRIFADFTFAIVVAAVWLWIRSGKTTVKLSLPFDDTNVWNFGLNPGTLFNGDILRYFSPEIFDPFIQEFVVDRPTILVLIVVIFYTMRKVRIKKVEVTKKWSVTVREKIRMSRNSSTDIANEEEQVTPQNSGKPDTE